MSILKGSIVSENWLTLWIGLFVFVLSLGLFVDVDILGWSIKTDILKSTDTVSKTYENLPGTVFLLFAYIFLFFTTGIVVKVFVISFKKFILPLTIAFFISYFCQLIGYYVNIAATSNTMDKFGISWVFFYRITPPIIS